MRIGIFHTTLLEPSGRLGSISGFLHTLATALVDQDHRVTFYSVTPPPPDAAYRHVPVCDPRLARSRAFRTLVLPGMLHKLNASDLDVLHLNGDDWFYLRRRLPTVRTFYGSALLEAVNAERRLVQAMYGCIFPLELLSARLSTRRYGIGPDSTAIYSATGTLPLVTRPTLPGWPARETRPTVLSVGTWLGRKRVVDVYRAFRDEVLPSEPDAQLWVVSPTKPPSHPWLRWFESPTTAELVDLYRRCWIYASASRYEGFGLPYLEAMQEGASVVGQSNPGATLVLGSGAYGVLVEGVTALGGAVRALLRDTDRRRDLAEAGQARAKDFSLERVVEKHLQAYEAAIEDFRGHRTASRRRE